VVQATAKAGGIKIAASAMGLRPDAASIATKR
jgi:hypothetical protein